MLQEFIFNHVDTNLCFMRTYNLYTLTNDNVSEVGFHLSII